MPPFDIGTIRLLIIRNDVKALYAFLDENTVPGLCLLAAGIAAEHDNLPIMSTLLAKLDPADNVMIFFYNTITYNAHACFKFLLSHPALDVMHQDGMFFKHAIDKNQLYMLSRLCCHPTAKLDDLFLCDNVKYAAECRNCPAALFLDAFIPPVCTK
jgi:hypothetical protein